MLGRLRRGSPNTPPEIDANVRWHADQRLEGRCVVCTTDGSHRLVLTVHGPDDNLRELLQCSNCESLFYKSPQILPFGGLFPDEYWRHYVEVGAGIHFMIRPLIEGAPHPDATLLDVGCGFGFTVDFWRRARGAAAVGLEPAAYGRVGRERLGAHIINSTLDEAVELVDDTFDLVYSTEVIEHVADPSTFAADLASRVARGGGLILTTPNAAAVHPAAAASSLIASLSPGSHYVMFSPSALEETLRQVGFPHVEVIEHEDRLLAFASTAPLERPAVDTVAPYIDYLQLVIDDEGADPYVRLGMTFRLLAELTNRGQYERAAIVSHRHTALCTEIFGAPPEKLAKRVLTAGRINIVQYGALAPYHLSPVLFYTAMLKRNHDRDPAQAQRLFTLAHRVAAAEVAADASSFQEAASLRWLAAFEAATAARDTGDSTRCLSDLTAVVAALSGRVDARSQTLLLRALTEIVKTYMWLGAWPECEGAMARTTAHLSNIAEEFAIHDEVEKARIWLCFASGVAALNGDGDAHAAIARLHHVRKLAHMAADRPFYDEAVNLAIESERLIAVAQNALGPDDERPL